MAAASPTTKTAGPIIIKNAHPSSWPAKKLTGNKFKRKFIETKSRSSSSTATTPVNTTLDAIAPTPVNHPVWGTKTKGDGNQDKDYEYDNSTTGATTTMCPPCLVEPDYKEPAIGFLTDWINAYIYLARKFVGFELRKSYTNTFKQKKWCSWESLTNQEDYM